MRNAIIIFIFFSVAAGSVRANEELPVVTSWFGNTYPIAQNGRLP
jgi:hypothetical protein